MEVIYNMARLKAIMQIEIEYDADISVYEVGNIEDAAAMDEQVFHDDPVSLLDWALEGSDVSSINVSVKVVE
jgi:hypothetical protein